MFHRLWKALGVHIHGCLISLINLGSVYGFSDRLVSLEPDEEPSRGMPIRQILKVRSKNSGHWRAEPSIVILSDGHFLIARTRVERPGVSILVDVDGLDVEIKHASAIELGNHLYIRLRLKSNQTSSGYIEVGGKRHEYRFDVSGARSFDFRLPQDDEASKLISVTARGDVNPLNNRLVYLSNDRNDEMLLWLESALAR